MVNKQLVLLGTIIILHIDTKCIALCITTGGCTVIDYRS